MTEILKREDKDAIATLTLNRPEALNPLSEEMLAALQETFDALSVDTSVRCVVLKGAGRAFCAGHDLKQMQGKRQQPDGGRAYYAALMSQCARICTHKTCDCILDPLAKSAFVLRQNNGAEGERILFKGNMHQV